MVLNVHRNRKTTLEEDELKQSELKSCVKVEVDVLGSPSRPNNYYRCEQKCSLYVFYNNPAPVIRSMQFHYCTVE